jgi:hypothetical protein
VTIFFEERPSDSPYIDTVTRGWTLSDGSATRPAETRWHMVFTKYGGRMHPLVVGPWTESGVVTYGEGAEILWIRFRLGTFMPGLPTAGFLNRETPLPDGAGTRFWLGGATWQFPDYENADTFADWLARGGALARDPVVSDALRGHPPDLSPRTVRHRFARSTGLTQSLIHQFERARQAAWLIERGVPLADAAFEAGYYDQPHLTRALKRFIGHTPGEIARAESQPG